jgi:hypothetical protein
MPSVDAIKRKGVQIAVRKVIKTGTNVVIEQVMGKDVEKHVPLWEADPESSELFTVRFDAYHLSEMETTFGNMDAWQARLEVQPFNTVLKTLAVLMDRQDDLKYVGECMIFTHIHEYQFALSSAWMMSVGLTDDDLAKIVSRAGKLGALRETMVRTMLEEKNPLDLLPEPEDMDELFRGNPSSLDGFVQDATSKTSGSELPEKSSSPSTSLSSETPQSPARKAPAKTRPAPAKSRSRRAPQSKP